MPAYTYNGSRHQPRPRSMSDTTGYHPYPPPQAATNAPSSSQQRPMTRLSPYQTFPRNMEHSIAWSPMTVTAAATWPMHTSPAPISPPGYRPMHNQRTRHAASQWTPHARHLYPTVPLPPQVRHDVDVISSLKSGSGLDIDLTMSPAALRQQGEEQMWERSWSEPATSPAVPSISVVHPALPWVITVHRTLYEYVTVEDVLRSVVEALASPVNIEYDRQVGDGRGRYAARTWLDFLPGKRLHGLRKSRRGEDVWVMEVI
ncbi:hypothetical protein D9758_013237 [Tetrapyrgos nigripes]|uniref:DUF6699 domain-containing protein n=1 Tax=Tetrapyrgos nigripes TaxID=182062 RepID=A0A8H5CP05_9AGAR|nr:hypothetical protein D9758_013237 [Tetrapyrgos nigripes]